MHGLTRIGTSPPTFKTYIIEQIPIKPMWNSYIPSTLIQNMPRVYSFLPVVLLLSFSLNSGCLSGSELRLFYSSGTVHLYMANGSFQSMSVNQVVCSTCAISFGEGVEIILRMDDHRFCSIRGNSSENNFTYAQLLDQIASQQSTGILSATIRFIASHFFEQKTDIRKYAESHLRQHGGIPRGCPYPIMLRPGNGELITSPEITFFWEAHTDEDLYEFALYVDEDSFADSKELTLIYSVELSDTTLVLQVSDISKLSNGESRFLWSVQPISPRQACTHYSFDLASKEVLKGKLLGLDSELDLTSSEQDILLQKIAAYEELGLFQLADDLYRRLVSKYQEPVYRELHLLFLARNGMI